MQCPDLELDSILGLQKSWLSLFCNVKFFSFFILFQTCKTHWCAILELDLCVASVALERGTWPGFLPWLSLSQHLTTRVSSNDDDYDDYDENHDDYDDDNYDDVVLAMAIVIKI